MLTKDLYQQKRSCKQPSAKLKKKKKKKKTYRTAHITEDTAEETQTHTHTQLMRNINRWKQHINPSDGSVSIKTLCCFC